jgi:hypothetical protein
MVNVNVKEAATIAIVDEQTPEVLFRQGAITRRVLNRSESLRQRRGTLWIELLDTT